MITPHSPAVEPIATNGLFEKRSEFLTYIREVKEGMITRYAVCNGEGVEMAKFASMDAAYYTARQFNLTPLTLH